MRSRRRKGTRQGKKLPRSAHCAPGIDGARRGRTVQLLAQQKIGQTQLDWQVVGLQTKEAQGHPDRQSWRAVTQ